MPAPQKIPTIMRSAFRTAFLGTDKKTVLVGHVADSLRRNIGMVFPFPKRVSPANPVGDRVRTRQTTPQAKRGNRTPPSKH